MSVSESQWLDEQGLDEEGLDGLIEDSYRVLVQRIEKLGINGVPPKPRGKNKIDILKFFRALRHKGTTGCPWRELPSRFGNWNSIQSRFLDWRAAGIFELIEGKLRMQGDRVFPWTGLDIKTRPKEQTDSDCQK